MRAAYGNHRKQRLIAKETLAPTQIAGFTQFFDDPNGSLSDLYGLGIDAVLYQDENGDPIIYGGLEATRRDIDRPFLSPNRTGATDDLSEDVLFSYLYALPADRIALTFMPSYETTKCDDNCEPIKRVSTWRLPFGVRYFDPIGLYGVIEYASIAQDVRRSNAHEDSESFGTLDFAVGWRLPRFDGAIQLTVRNGFGENFDYQDDSFRADGPATIAVRSRAERTSVGDLELLM